MTFNLSYLPVFQEQIFVYFHFFHVPYLLYFVPIVLPIVFVVRYNVEMLDTKSLFLDQCF